MTNRELFYGFYRVWRLRESELSGLHHTQPGADELYIKLVAAAARMGLSDSEVEWLAFESAGVRVARSFGPYEPSANSTKIQMLVHTHGRVRKSTRVKMLMRNFGYSRKDA